MVINFNKLYNSKFFHFFTTVFNFNSEMNVQLSSKGSKLLNDKKLASKVIERIIIDHKKLDDGQNVIIEDDDSSKIITVTMVSSKFDEKID